MPSICGPNFIQIGRSPNFWERFEILGYIGRNGNEKFKMA